MKSFLFITVFTIFYCHTMAQNKTYTPTTFDKEAHRGGRGLMPENTIAAMKNAINLGVNTLELDVQVSKDGQVIVSHDPYFNYLYTTLPNGDTLTEKNGKQMRIYDLNYDSIRKIDVGMKFRADFPLQQKVPAYKPLLGELIDSAEKYASTKGRKIYYNIEIKSKTGGENKIHPQVPEYVDKTISIILNHKIAARTVIQSFDIRALQYMRLKYPFFSLSYLVDKNVAKTLDEQLHTLTFVPEIYSPAYEIVTPDLIKDCHSKKIKIIPWTVNSETEIQQLKSMGVDGIISDYPNYL